MPISSVKLTNQIADAILAGEFPPGTRLEEEMLAARYNVSRTPVREALRELSSTGIVEIWPRRGAIVAEMTSATLESLFVAMGEIEAACARLAAMQMSPLERRRLQTQHESMASLVERQDLEGFASANLVLHGLIYAGSHNRPLEEIAKGLRQRLAPFRRAQFRNVGRLANSQAEHGVVVNAVVAGRAAEAHAAMLLHMGYVEEAFDRLIALGA